MLFQRNKPVRCLQCSREFKLSEALLVPVSTPASPEANVAQAAINVRLNRLPLDYNRVCPQDKWPLTYAQATGQLELQPIAIAGGPGVSKSHYIPVLIDQAKRRLRNTLHGFDLLAQETREPGASYPVCSDHLLANRYGRLFADDDLGTVIAKTQHSAGNVDARTPMIYRFTFPTAWQFLTGRRRCVEFAFRDCAGEEFTDPSALHDFHRYITHSAGILLLVDPTTIPGLRERLPNDAIAQRAQSRPLEIDQIVSRLIGLFERVENIRVGKRIKTPLALVLTKADVLRRLNSSAAGMFREPESLHIDGFDRDGFIRQDSQLRQLLNDCGQSSLLASLDAKFSSVGIFAVSALGHEPTIQSAGKNGEGEQRVGRIQPWRVLDPLVWLFYHYAYIGAMRSNTTCTS